MTDETITQDSQAEQKRKEAYFTASQGQLIWARFKKNKAAMIAGSVLIFMILAGLLAPFLSPYDPTIAGRNDKYLNGAPRIPVFCDQNGCSWRPFLHGLKRTRSAATNYRWVTEVEPRRKALCPVFPEGLEIHFLQAPNWPAGNGYRFHYSGHHLRPAPFWHRQGWHPSFRNGCKRQRYIRTNLARHFYLACRGDDRCAD